MKVAFAIDRLDVRGGTHKGLLRLCEYVEKQNMDFVILTKLYDKEKTYPEFKKYKVISLYNCDGNLYSRKNANFFSRLSSDRELFKMLPQDIDIVNVHDSDLYNFIYLCKLDNKKVVWQVNDLPDVYRVGAAKRRKKTIKSLIKKLIIERQINKVDAITVAVKKNGDRVEKYMHKKAYVFYPGVDINESLEIHSYPEKIEKFNLLSMGVFFPYRNYETLVLVVKEMLDRGKPIHLNIIGSTEFDSTYANYVRNLIKENMLDSLITVCGQVDERTYTELFNNANAFAFINIDQSWGLAVFEAMSCGLPTIVSNSVGATELLNNDIDSIIVDPLNVSEICDQIEKLMNDKEYYDRISDAGMKAARSFTWDSMINSQTYELFQKITNGELD